MSLAACISGRDFGHVCRRVPAQMWGRGLDVHAILGYRCNLATRDCDFAPTATPTDIPTALPTDTPTLAPTEQAIPNPATEYPTTSPTPTPTDPPTAMPTHQPTEPLPPPAVRPRRTGTRPPS